MMCDVQGRGRGRGKGRGKEEKLVGESRREVGREKLAVAVESSNDVVRVS